VYFCPFILGVQSLAVALYVSVPPIFALVGFGPSRLVFATMTSADFLPFVVTTVIPLTRPPQVRTLSFTPYIRHLYMSGSV